MCCESIPVCALAQFDINSKGRSAITDTGFQIGPIIYLLYLLFNPCQPNSLNTFLFDSSSVCVLETEGQLGWPSINGR